MTDSEAKWALLGIVMAIISICLSIYNLFVMVSL